MYLTLYKNNPNTIFTPPAATPSLSNYNTTAEGSRGSIWKCLRYQDNVGDGEWVGSQQNPGGILPTCSTSPPVGTCTIGEKCIDIDPILGTIYYTCEQEAPTYTYYWDLLVDGMPEIIYGGIIRNAKEDITRRVYDKDTSKFEGLSDELLDEPLVFVAKEDDDTYIYSGYVNSWSQNDKLVTFKGIDFKSIFDTEIKLDFYADMISVNLQVTTILNKVFNNFSNNHPGLNFTIPTITTDTAYISNLLGQVFTTNALKFLKVYLVTFGLFIIPVFNEITKEIDVSIETNNQSETIRLDDFVFESTKTDTKINKCIATIADKQEEEYTEEIVWLRSNAAYYNSLPADKKMTGAGKNDNFSSSDFFNPTSSHNIGSLMIGIKQYDVLNIYLTSTAKTLLSNEEKAILFIPYHDYFDFKKSFMSFDYISTGQYYTARLDTNSVPSEYIKMNHLGDKVPFTDFGQGWIALDVTKLYTDKGFPDYISFGIVIKEDITTTQINGMADVYKDSFKLAKEKLQDEVEIYLFDTPKVEHPWYMKPTDKPTYEGDVPPFGFGYRSYDGTNYYYWQIGQVPREPKNIPEKAFYLGKDNQVYEEYIAPANQIYPVQTKIYAEEFFYKAQFNAIYELVNNRFNENIIIIDNKVLNPIELANLGLNAQIIVFDKMNNIATLPISEIQIKNGEKKVKLGFKKTRFTEVIKS